MEKGDAKKGFVGSSFCFLNRCSGKAFAFNGACVGLVKRKKETEEKLGVVIPSLPCPDMLPPDGKNAMSVFPVSLVKGAERDDSVVGRKSGKRSAIVEVDGIYYRLKGCGNQAEGVVTRVMDGNREIRGVCFEATCVRELEMSRRIRDLLEKRGLVCGNVGYGWFQYESLPEFPSVGICCSVFRTVGDLRLSDHFLAGLDDIACSLFRSNAINKQKTWVKLLEADDAENLEENLVDLSAQDMWECLDAQHVKGVNDDLVEQWSGIGEEDRVKGVGKLLFRIGFEARRIVETLHEGNICWGTYKDALGSHCNAHPNNFIVLRMTEDNDNILAACDFDMAFESEEYLLEDFAELLKREKLLMRMGLAGYGMNSGVQEVHANEGEMEWDVRDTVIAGWESSNIPEDRQFAGKQKEAAAVLMEMAMSVRKNFVA